MEIDSIRIRGCLVEGMGVDVVLETGLPLQSRSSQVRLVRAGRIRLRS